MKIKILQSRAGHAQPQHRLADFSFPPGAVIDIAPFLAQAWIASKTAIAADKAEKLTMPTEVYTLPEPPKPEPSKPAQAELPTASQQEESAS